MKRNLLLLILVFCEAVVGNATVNNYLFKHISVVNGLSNNQVNDIYRDEKGFMWFSTASGLNRYDGYEIKTFRHTSDSSSIASNHVDWCRDLDDVLMMVKTNSVYSLFNKRTETFCSADELFGSMGITSPITCVFVDSNSNIWIACGKSCYVYSFKDSRLLNRGSEAFEPYDGNVSSFCSNKGSMMVVYTDGTIVECSYSDLLRVESTIKAPVGEGIYGLFVDSQGDSWLYSYDLKGIYFYSKSSDKWHLCNADAESYYQITQYSVNSIAEDGHGNIWVVSDHGGISIIDKPTHGVTRVLNRKNDGRSVASNSIICVYHDSEDIMWIGDVRAGISLYNESIYKFDVDLFNYDDVEEQFSAQINTIEEDRQGNLWFGSNGHGILYTNSSTNTKKLYRHSADRQSLSSDIIVDLHADSKGKMWVGTYLGGLCCFDGVSFISYKGSQSVPPAVSADNIWAISEDADNNIWVGSLGSGAAMFDANTGKWTEYHIDALHQPSDYVSQIVPSKDGRVFFGTAVGVYVLNRINGTFTKIGVEGNSNAETDNINDIFVDSRGLLWVGSRDGLFVYDTKEYKLQKMFSVENGLRYDLITGIVEDNDKNMWVTTTRGITNIIVNPNPRSDEYTFSIYNYDELDGFLKGSVNTRSIKKTSHGEIFVGGDPGVVRFLPEEIKYNKKVPEVSFTGMSVLGSQVKIGETKTGNVILPVALPYADSVSLNYSDNMFSVSFSTLSCILPDKVTFHYMLEGFNNQWLNADGHSVTYTNLAPGTYKLKVRATNCDGFSNESSSELLITILPPWWKTTWAYVAYALLFVMILFLIRKQIESREKEKYKLQQIEAEVQKKHELDEVKLSFFTNISHELRTPLSLIISPLENIMSKTDDQALKTKLELIHRNAQKLHNMVSQLLDFRKADVNGMQLNQCYGDLVGFVKQCSNSFFELSERSVRCEFSSAVESLYTEFDRDKIGKVINNLLSNAFKFTPDEGRIDVWVGQSADGQQAIIKVSDTGIGIDDKYKEHIFDRFYQVPQPSSSSFAGSGIGLHLVKEFVAMHNGTVAVGDNVGQGTVFAVMLPIVHTEEEDVSVDSDEESQEAQVNANAKPQIVVVDDNADFRTLLSDTLEDMFDVKQAKNGQEAWEMIVKILPDLVIADVMMPVMDGNDLCRMIKNDVRTSHIPVIMLTAMTATEHKIEGLTNGADDYLTKPFNTQILRLRINKLIELGKKRQEVFKHQIDPEPSEITITPLDEKLIQKAIQYVEDNISDTELSVEEMSRNLGMSRVHLYKKLLSITGRSPIEFIRVIRLKRAAQLLRDKQQNVSDVAYAVGFNNPKYFSRYFKEEFGVLPSVYQNNTESIIPNTGLDKV